MTFPTVTYKDYTELWNTGLSESNFSAALPEAQARVNARLALFDLSTLSGDDLTTYKRAVCAACDRVTSPKAESWSAGKASMSFLDGDTSTMTVDAAIERCLAGTRLSYVGI